MHTIDYILIRIIHLKVGSRVPLLGVDETGKLRIKRKKAHSDGSTNAQLLIMYKMYVPNNSSVESLCTACGQVT